MAERQNYKLTDRLIKSLCSESPLKIKRHSDGDNLYLFHEPDGGIYWIYEYRFQSDKDIMPKRKNFRIGIYKSASKQLTNTFKPDIGIKEARQERDRLKTLVKQGIDPYQQKKQKKVVVTNSDLFKNLVADFLQQKIATTTPSYVAKTQRFFDNHILKHLGSYPIQSITAQDVIKMGQAIEAQAMQKDNKPTSYTAHKCIGLVSEVFNFAIDVKGYNVANIASGRTRALRPHTAERMKKVELQEFPELLKRIDGYCDKHQKADMQTSLALQLIALCFVRTQELRFFEWSEIDYSRGVWRIPASKMKKRREHIIPLAPQARAILERLRPLTETTGYVFFNFQKNQPFSEAWLNQALERMGYKGQMTGHGFRGLASTSLNELKYPKEVIELQLAHLEETSTASRYDTSSQLVERQNMMHRWANHLDDLRAGKHIALDLLPPIDNGMDKEFELFKQLREKGLLDAILANVGISNK